MVRSDTQWSISVVLEQGFPEGQIVRPVVSFSGKLVYWNSFSELVRFGLLGEGILVVFSRLSGSQ